MLSAPDYYGSGYHGRWHWSDDQRGGGGPTVGLNSCTDWNENLCVSD